MRVPALIFADDVVMLATSRNGLQKKLEILEQFSEDRQLPVNLQKTQIVVFGGQLQAQQRQGTFWYAKRRVELVKSYKYLGVWFDCSISFSKAARELSDAGRKAVFGLEARCKEVGITSPKTRVALFDSLVRPILDYGAEVWGPGFGVEWGWNGDGDCLELVHRAFLRGLLRARKSVFSKALLGEFGRFP